MIAHHLAWPHADELYAYLCLHLIASLMHQINLKFVKYLRSKCDIAVDIKYICTQNIELKDVRFVRRGKGPARRTSIAIANHPPITVLAASNLAANGHAFTIMHLTTLTQ